MKSLETLKALLARATHSETPVEEARTSAMAACKMLVSGSFKIIDDSKPFKQTGDFSVPRPPRPRRQPPPKPATKAVEEVFFSLVAVGNLIHAIKNLPAATWLGMRVAAMCEREIALPGAIMEITNVRTYASDAHKQWPNYFFCQRCGDITSDIAARTWFKGVGFT